MRSHCFAHVEAFLAGVPARIEKDGLRGNSITTVDPSKTAPFPRPVSAHRPIPVVPVGNPPRARWD